MDLSGNRLEEALLQVLGRIAGKDEDCVRRECRGVQFGQKRKLCRVGHLIGFIN